MTYQGTRLLDATETNQVRWLVVTAEECPNQNAEQQLSRQYFLVPHATWSWPQAFAQPVAVWRTRRRVLLSQQFGVDL